MASTVWAHVTNGECDNIIVLDPATSNGYPMDGLVEVDGLNPMPGIGWRYDGNNWTVPPAPTLVADPYQISGTETSTITYTWQGWPEDTPPDSVEFQVGSTSNTQPLVNDTASVTVSSSDSEDGKTVVVQCAGLTAIVTIQ